MKNRDENKAKKNVKFVPGKGDKEFKRMYQAAPKEKQMKMGYDIPNDADEWDMEIVRQANEWLRDGQPVN